MNHLSVRLIKPSDEQAVASLIVTSWGARKVVTRGHAYDAATLPGLLALIEGKIVGLLTCRVDNHECEIVTLDAFRTRQGIGSRLIEEIKRFAHSQGCTRLWLITTNDNVEAMAFYQKHGFRLVAIHRDAVTLARKLKPQIPLIATNGIPIRDEIELEVTFEP
jgi:ribosomal protein S18 acetylase RimI-like enzyme